MIRRYGESVRVGKRYRLRPGVYAILWNGSQMLLTFQSEPLPELQLPGGGVDPGESPGPALAREVLEETGWTLSGARRLGAFRRFTYMPEYKLWAEKLCHIYVARPALRRGLPSEAHHEVVWMSPRDAVAALGNEGDAAFVQSFFGRNI